MKTVSDVFCISLELQFVWRGIACSSLWVLESTLYVTLAFTNVSYWSCSSCFRVRTVSTIVWSAISWLYRLSRSSPRLLKGFPFSSITSVSDLTSLTNAFWTYLICSWCPRFAVFWLVSTIDSNSPISRDICGQHTIERLRAAGFSVRPTAPPSPFTATLFCSWAWSMATAENGRAVFVTVKFPFRNSEYTSGRRYLSVTNTANWLESTRRSLCGRRRRTTKQFCQGHLCTKENLPLGSLGQRSSPPLPAAEPSTKTGTGDLFQHCDSTILRLTSASLLLLDFFF